MQPAMKAKRLIKVKSGTGSSLNVEKPTLRRRGRVVKYY